MAWNNAGICPNCGKDMESDGPTNIRHVENQSKRCPK